MNENPAQVADREDAAHERKARRVDFALLYALLVAVAFFVYIMNFAQEF